MHHPRPGERDARRGPGCRPGVVPGAGVVSLGGMYSHSVGLVLGAALLLGLVAGMRSMMPLAAVGLLLWLHPLLAPDHAPVHWFVHPLLGVVLMLAAAGELVVDKLPGTPKRTALAPFLGRAITGGLAGAVAVQIGHVSGWIGAGIGVVAAILSTFAMYNARRAVDAATGAPDPFVGGGEDVLSIVLAFTAAWMLLT